MQVHMMAANYLSPSCGSLFAWLSSYTHVSVKDTRTKLDSHTDTTAMGSSTTFVLHDYKQPVCVHGC